MITKYLSVFETYFETALDLLYSNLGKDINPAIGHFMECARYNVPHGKKIRGVLCVAACETFSYDKMTPEKRRAANLVGWCIEFMQSSFLVFDDIIDGSPLRRGQKSWYLVQENLGRGLISVNDGLHLYLCVQQLLFAALSDSSLQPVLLKLTKIFADAAHFTCFGQALDIMGFNSQQCLSAQKRVHEENNTPLSTHQKFPKDISSRLQNMDKENFQVIAKWKTGYYSFVLPVTAGMLLAGVDDETKLDDARTILLRIGELFQAQDDFLDVFVDETVTGKVGTDIADGKCSWLIAAALERASEDQLEVLDRHYGISDAASVAAVHKIFVDLDLPTVFEAYEIKMRSEISSLIDRFCLMQKARDSFGDESEFFHSILEMLFKRKK